MGKIADISKWQGTIDWSKASKELDLAIMRVQYGSTTMDSKYKEYVAGAKQYGVPFGAYAYGQFVSVNDAIQEAKDFYARTDKSSTVYVVDVEEVTTNKASDLVPATQAFIDYLRSQGVKKVGLYTGDSFYKEHELSKVDADFLWIARYGVNNGSPSTKPSVACDLWQYTSVGTVSGISGNVDLNALNGSKKLSYFTTLVTETEDDNDDAEVEIPVEAPADNTEDETEVPIDESDDGEIVEPEEDIEIIVEEPEPSEEITYDSVLVNPNNLLTSYIVRNGENVPKPQIFLANPRGTVLYKISEANNKKLTINFTKPNELSFSIPYSINKHNKIVRNKAVDILRERFLIKLLFAGIETWYVITTREPSSDDSGDWLNVQAYSLEYELNYKKMIGYKATSYNCAQVLNDTLKETNWSIGYINDEFNLKYRQFDVSSSSKLDFINQICSSFNAYVVYDTINKKVNICKEEEVSVYKGFWIEYGKYMQTVSQSTPLDDLVTRLYVNGTDEASINSVNPTGQSYIDDFSYFMYPFDMDESGNVTSHSYYMSDSLCLALVKYNNLIDANSTSFSDLLKAKTQLQTELSTLNTELSSLKSEFQVILDNIQIAKKGGDSATDLVKERDAKQTEIDNKQTEINNKQADIDTNTNTTSNLNSLLKLENNFSPSLLRELYNYVLVGEFSDNNQTNDEDLYEVAIKYFKTVNTPPINLSLSIVNFFAVLEEKHNWDRLSIGDIIRVRHNKLGIDIKATVDSLSFDFEGNSIGITVTNVKRPKSVLEKMSKAMYSIDKVNTDYSKRKPNWDNILTNFNLRNDRISTTPNNPKNVFVSHKTNDNGSVDLTVSWEYEDYTKTEKDADNIDGFVIYMYAYTDSEKHVFGSKMVDETEIGVNLSTRTYTFPSVPPNPFYTLGVQAYREVDDDIDSTGRIFSTLIYPSGDKQYPYQPSEVVLVNGHLNGRVNGTKYVTSDVEPIEAMANDQWTDTSGEVPIVKVSNGEEWVETGTSSANIINPTALNVKSYGAVGDGVADDTVAFQKGIIDSSTRGIPLQVPKGEYFIKGWLRLYSNLTINLSDDAWLIKKVGASTSKLFQALSGASKGYGSGGRNIIISGGNMKGDLDNDISITNSFHHVTELTIKNLNVEHAVYQGHFADLMACENVLIDNCSFKGFKVSTDRAYTETIQIDNSSYAGAGGGDNQLSYDGLPTHDVTIHNCEFLPIYNEDGSIKYHAPNITGSHAQIRGLPPYNITVDNNVIKGGAPIFSDADSYRTGWIHFRGGYNISITRNKFYNLNSIVSKVINFYRTAWAYEVTDLDNADSPSVQGVPNECYNIKVENNYFEGFNFPDVTALCAFTGYVWNNESYKIKDVSITGNTYKNCFDESQIGEKVSGDLNYLSYVSRLTMKQNNVDGARRLAYLNQVDNFSITDNPINKSYYLAFSVSDSISGSLSNNQIDNSISAIMLAGACRNVNINNNQINNPLPPANAYDSVLIDIRGTASNCNVNNNTLDGNNKVDIGIRAASTTGVGFIKDNIIQDITTKVSVDSGSGMTATNNI